MALKLLSIIAVSVLDIISGIVKVLRNGNTLQSSKMASGLYKKISNFVCLITALLIDRFLNDYINIQFFNFVYVYIFSMECLSIYENCGQAGLLAKLKEVLKIENK